MSYATLHNSNGSAPEPANKPGMFSFLTNLKDHHRVIASAGVPLVLFLVALNIMLWEQWQTSTEMRRVEQVAEIAPTISDLVHELQKERGASAGFVGQDGQGVFQGRLSNQSPDTDRALVSFNVTLDNFDVDAYGSQFSSRVADARRRLGQLDAMRSRVSNLSATVPELASYYTGTIASLLDIIGEIAIISTDAEISNQITAYLSFLQAKEQTGVERAIGAGAFGAQQFSRAAHERFVALVGQQEALLSTFRKYATAEHVREYESTVSGRAVDEVARMRAIGIANGYGEPIQGVTGGYWFDTITAKIDLMKEVEDILAEDLVHVAVVKGSAAQTTFNITAIIALLFLVGTCALVFFVVRSVVRSISENWRIRSALNACSTNVMIADANYDIAYMNGAMVEMMRHAESDIRKELPNLDANRLLGTNMDQFHENPALMHSMFDKLTRAHETSITLGGRTFELVATPVFSEDNVRLGTVVEWADVTEMLKEEEERTRMERENRRVRFALDACSTNVMIADASYDIVYMNRTMVEMMQAAEADLRKDVPSLDTKKLIGTNIDTFHKSPAHQRGILDGLSSTCGADIEAGGRSFHLAANPILNDEGERIGTSVEWSDETAQKAIEGEINGIVAAATIGDFSNSISLEGKTGFYKNLAQGINALSGQVGAAMEEIVGVLGALADGDLTKRVASDYEGLFDRLKSDANRMADQLFAIVSEIKNSAGEVARAAEQISTGTTDLSSRTEQQAANLQETAASMEEIATTVKQNAENASQANQLAVTARQSAVEGGEIVQNTVKAMSNIEDSSKRISEIIGVIDEIAFQTNLLALNAAVEAARAGEAGRGFAVVASEVRTLAQRSSQAAKDIKELISHSTDQVQDGAKLVNTAGESLDAIVDSIKNVADIVSEIAAASNQQATGVDEINTAIGQMDEMTQQNSALVDENAAAARAMSDSSVAMSQRMSFFTLSEEHGDKMEATQIVKSPRSAPAVRTPASKANGSARQMQTALAVAVDEDTDWKEF